VSIRPNDLLDRSYEERRGRQGICSFRVQGQV